MQTDEAYESDHDLEQEEFESVEFAENPEARCPCILLLDTSASMRGEPMAELNEGLVTFKDELSADSLASKRVEVAIVTFGPVKVEQNFQTAIDFQPPTLQANHDTPMGEAILRSLDLLSSRKAEYQANGISYYRPWIFLVTDGAPTDEWSQAAQDVRQGEEDGAFIFFSVAVQKARMDILEQIAVRQPVHLEGLRFREMFKWLSNSMRIVSSSNPGDEISLEDPTGPDGWATISL